MRNIATAFLMLIVAQAAHSLEEFTFRLWNVLPPAAAISRAISLDPRIGFAVVNSALVLFGLLCWARAVRRRTAWARPLAWGWAILELANGVAHSALAIAAGGYFPGLYTAPLLILASAWLMLTLIAAPARSVR